MSKLPIFEHCLSVGNLKPKLERFFKPKLNPIIFLLNWALEEWNLWKIIHEKEYESATEEKFRMKIYMENKAYIARHNHRAHRGMHSYFLKMNHFGDHLHHEFTAKMGGCYRADLKNLTHVQVCITRMDSDLTRNTGRHIR